MIRLEHFRCDFRGKLSLLFDHLADVVIRQVLGAAFQRILAKLLEIDILHQFGLLSRSILAHGAGRGKKRGGENVKEIKRRREARGMKQVELADALGVSQPTIVTWESAEGYPPSRFLPALAAVLCCTIDELYADEPPQAAF